ncbi:MAG: hypothetical protein ACLFTY_04080 [Candidatus Aenigmatarchaeota archaeon]
MNKIDSVKGIAKDTGIKPEEVRIVPENSEQKKWRESEFLVYSKNKEEDNFQLLVFDNSDPVKFRGLTDRTKIVVVFQDLAGSLEEAESTLEQFLEANLDHRNSVYSDRKDGINKEYKKIAFQDGNKVIILTDDRKLIEDIDVEGSGNFYFSWIKQLEKTIVKRKKEIELKEKDIEALEKHIERLGEDFQERIKRIEAEKEEIEDLKQKKEGIIENKEEELETKEERIDELREENEELKRKKDNEINELKEELAAIKGSLSYKLGSSLGDTKFGKLLKDE